MTILQFAQNLKQLGFTTYYVGGSIRDHFINFFKEPSDNFVPKNDIDLCITGVKDIDFFDKYLKILLEDNVSPVVGKSFPVWIADIEGKKIDIALARKEKLIGTYRTDFQCSTENVTIEEDLFRRDFTINAIAINVITKELVDPYNGVNDIQEGLLRPVSEAFKEDSLRILRGARFAARFGFLPTEEFYNYAKELDASDISNERVGIELKKCLQECPKPSLFFEVLRKADWLKYHFKELEDCIGVPQSQVHHPEGDVYVHTLHCMDAADDWFIRAVMLIHDLGKATMTTIDGVPYDKWEGGKQGYSAHDFMIRSICHEEESAVIGRKMLKRIHLCGNKTLQQICLLAELHMIRTSISEKTIRRTLRKLMNYKLKYEQLVEVCRCDVSGRPPLKGYTPDIGQDRAKELLDNGDMNPIVTGEVLVQLGLEPGKEMGEMIEKALVFQDRGTLNKINWKSVLRGAGFKSLKKYMSYE